MPRYIDADKIQYGAIAYPVYNINTGMASMEYLDGEYAKREDIEALADKEVQEVRRAKWETTKSTARLYRCSRCHMVADYISRYCPHCGSLMS